MFDIKVEASFKTDYKRVTRKHPEVREEFRRAAALLGANGSLPEEYGSHELSNPGGNYNGHIEFHLAEGHFAVLVIYMPHKTNHSIRLIRMGSHDDLFRGELR